MEIVNPQDAVPGGGEGGGCTKPGGDVRDGVCVTCGVAVSVDQVTWMQGGLASRGINQHGNAVELEKLEERASLLSASTMGEAFDRLEELVAKEKELAKTRADVEKLTTALDIVALREIRQAADLAIAERERDRLRKVLDAANETTAAARQIVTAALADGTARVVPPAPCGCLRHKHQDGSVTLIEDLCCPFHGVAATPSASDEYELVPTANPATTAEPADEDELVPHVEPVSAETIAGMAAMSQIRNPEVFAPWDDDAEPAAS